MEFTDPQVILLVADCERDAAFYAAFGFPETFRAPEAEADPVKIEMTLGGSGLAAYALKRNSTTSPSAIT